MRYGSADTVITKSASFERGEAILFATQAEEQNEAPAPATSNAENSDSPFRVLSHPAILALFITHMVYNLTTLSINSWMPTYYADVLKLPPESAKLHLTLPHLTALLLKLTVSNVATMIRGSGYSMLFSRRIMCAVGFVATALPLVLIPYVSDVSKHSVWATTVLFCLALAGTGFHAEVRACIHASHITHPLDHPPTPTPPLPYSLQTQGFRANYLDVTAKHVGLVSGVGNCLSSVAAMVAPLLVGQMVQQSGGEWGLVWQSASAACVASAAVFCGLSTVTPVEATFNKKEKAA